MAIGKEIVQRYIRNMTLALAILVFAAVGLYLAGLYWDYAIAHNSMFSFRVADNVGVDLYGAIIPLVAGACSAALFVFFKFSSTRFAVCFVVSLAFAFFIFQVTKEGLMGRPLVFALLSGLATALIIFLSRPLAETKGKSLASLLASLSCAAFSLLLLDLVYTPFFYGSTIGGYGLTDGVLISTMYAPLWATIAASIITLLVQTFVFLKNYALRK